MSYTALEVLHWTKVVFVGAQSVPEICFSPHKPSLRYVHTQALRDWELVFPTWTWTAFMSNLSIPDQKTGWDGVRDGTGTGMGIPGIPLTLSDRKGIAIFSSKLGSITLQSGSRQKPPSDSAMISDAEDKPGIQNLVYSLSLATFWMKVKR